MKRWLCLIGGGLLLTFAVGCFFEFFLAWNMLEHVRVLQAENLNFFFDLQLSYPVNKYVAHMISIPNHFTLQDMLACIFNEKSQYGGSTGFLIFTRENWLQMTLFMILAVMLVLKFFKYKSNNKAISVVFTALAVLAVWMTVKDFAAQWSDMFGDKYNEEGWKSYFFANREQSKVFVMLYMVLHTIPQLLLALTFASMASMVKSQGKKSVAKPVVLAVLYMIVELAYNVTGLGFAVKWPITSAVIFFAVDALLVVGIWMTAIAAKGKKAKK